MSFGSNPPVATSSSLPANGQFSRPKPSFHLPNMISSSNNKNSNMPLPPGSDPKRLLEMEPNPFEMSFKEREKTTAAAAAAVNKTSTASSASSSVSSSSSLSSMGLDKSMAKPATGSAASPPLFSGAQFLTPGGRRILPPMSAISSPSSLLANGTASPGWSESLRSGPLSPAMLQGPQQQQQLQLQLQQQQQLQLQQQQQQHSNTTSSVALPTTTATATSSSLLNLANATSVAAPVPTTVTTNAPFMTATASTMRPGPLSPFAHTLSNSILQSDPSLFPTPGPATAALLSSIGNDLINGSTGLTPLGFKVPTGTTPGGGGTTAAFANSLLATNSGAINNTTGVNKSGITSVIGITATTGVTSAVPAATIPTSAAVTTTAQVTDTLGATAGNNVHQQQQRQPPGAPASPAPTSTYNGSVDAANSLYLMSKSLNTHPSQQTHNPVALQGLPREQAPNKPLVTTGGSPATVLSATTSSATANSVPLQSQQQKLHSHQQPQPPQLQIPQRPQTHATVPPQNAIPTVTKGEKSSLPDAGSGTTNTKKSTGRGSGRKRKQSNASDGMHSQNEHRVKKERNERPDPEMSDYTDEENEHASSADSRLKSSMSTSPSSSSNSASFSGVKQEKKKMSAEEKRKSFLERNRIAALKCRQRKKQWTEDLQEKVELYSSENEILNKQLASAREEIGNLRALLLQHKNCSLGIPQETLTLLMANSPISVTMPYSQQRQQQQQQQQQTQQGPGELSHLAPQGAAYEPSSQSSSFRLQ